jgi:two-component system sensor histidine kinase CpxA
MKVLVFAGEPERYWAAVLMPPQIVTQGPPRPLMYVITTRSIFTNGLLFDAQPWLIGMGAALGFSALLWLPMVRGITGKIKETMRATEQMAQGKFDIRIKENRSDELGRLAAGVNRMAQQLDGYVTGQRRFTGDIAHELCSPISRMQAALGILEARAGDEKQQRHIATLNDELQHMSHLVQELLQFSKASLHRDLTFYDMNLADLAHEIANRESQGYPGDAVQVQIPDDLLVRAEPELLSRALGNVIRNALRYAGEAGPVLLTAAAQEDRVVINISDEGPGVPPEALPKLFDAFFRPDAYRGREHGGAGLGLAIVKSAVEACHGTVSVSNRVPSGLEITLVLPGCRPAPA